MDVEAECVAELDKANERIADLEAVLTDMTVRFGGMENAYHLQPSFDRPRKGCRACGSIDRALAVLKTPDPSKAGQDDR